MRYNPRIFIRDYGEPTARALLNAGGFVLNARSARLLRALFFRIFNDDAGEPGILLSGDMQSGTDLVLLSGEVGYLVQASDANLRAFFPDIGLLYISNLDSVALSGDAQSGSDALELSGDMQSGTDTLKLS